MLYYGTSSMLPYLRYDTIVYNITSYREDLERLNLLPPYDNRLFDNSCYEFDVWYAQWIFNNDPIFFDFFKIIYNLYNGHDVFLCMDDGDWSENLVESLLKLIQQRYGYNGCQIDSFESYVYSQNNIESRFEDFGLYNLDQDKERFSLLWVQYDPKMFAQLKREAELDD